MIASPSIMPPVSSTAITRSASPSWANPTSAPCWRTAFRITSGLLEPQRTLIRAPSGASLIRINVAHSSYRTIDDHPHPADRARRVGGDVINVDVRRVGEHFRAADLPANRARQIVPVQDRFDGVLDGIGELVAVTGKKLDPVVLDRIVRR